MDKKVLFELKSEDKHLLIFFCLGCGYNHPYEVPRWNWNGSYTRPTFTPSLLCNASYPEHRCHLFVTDGKIQYCSDCHHKLAGQTVDMISLDEDGLPEDLPMGKIYD